MVSNSQATPQLIAWSTGAENALLGLRERVTALGGHLRAGPRPDGGYTLGADLPGMPA